MSATSVSATGKVSEGVMHRKLEETVEKNEKTYFRFRTWTEGLPHQNDYSELIRKDDKGYYSIDGRDAGAVE